MAEVAESVLTRVFTPGGVSSSSRIYRGMIGGLSRETIGIERNVRALAFRFAADVSWRVRR